MTTRDTRKLGPGLHAIQPNTTHHVLDRRRLLLFISTRHRASPLCFPHLTMPSSTQSSSDPDALLTGWPKREIKPCVIDTWRAKTPYSRGGLGLARMTEVECRSGQEKILGGEIAYKQGGSTLSLFCFSSLSLSLIIFAYLSSPSSSSYPNSNS